MWRARWAIRLTTIRSPGSLRPHGDFVDKLTELEATLDEMMATREAREENLVILDESLRFFDDELGPLLRAEDETLLAATGGHNRAIRDARQRHIVRTRRDPSQRREIAASPRRPATPTELLGRHPGGEPATESSLCNSYGTTSGKSG